jgi:protein-tyrosine phosphatase
MRSKIEQYNLEASVDSAGTANYHVGESPDPRSQESGLKHGVDISMLKGRQFEVGDFDRFDRIYVMDKSNYGNVLAMARGEDDKTKVDMLLNAANPNTFQEVPDPYWSGPDGFEDVYQMMNKACEAIAQDLKNG